MEFLDASAALTTYNYSLKVLLNFSFPFLHNLEHYFCETDDMFFFWAIIQDGGYGQQIKKAYQEYKIKGLYT